MSRDRHWRVARCRVARHDCRWRRLGARGCNRVTAAVPTPNFAGPHLAARMGAIEPFHVMEVQRRAFELEAEGRRVIHMEIGQPDFPAPQPVVEAAIAALGREPMGYTDALGIRALRE